MEHQVGCSQQMSQKLHRAKMRSTTATNRSAWQVNSVGIKN